MKPNIIKAVVAMERFFTYNIEPEEFSALLHRIDTQNDRDMSIIESLCETLDQAGITISK